MGRIDPPPSFLGHEQELEGHRQPSITLPSSFRRAGTGLDGGKGGFNGIGGS
jgi:hypothetical protein